jgi:hypothetical protein
VRADVQRQVHERSVHGLLYRAVEVDPLAVALVELVAHRFVTARQLERRVAGVPAAQAPAVLQRRRERDRLDRRPEQRALLAGRADLVLEEVRPAVHRHDGPVAGADGRQADLDALVVLLGNSSFTACTAAACIVRLKVERTRRPPASISSSSKPRVTSSR